MKLKNELIKKIYISLALILHQRPLLGSARTNKEDEENLRRKTIKKNSLKVL
jgi:hypothetical protein